MNRRDFLRRSALVAAGAVAADQLEIVERLGWRRRLFAGWRAPHPLTREPIVQIVDQYGAVIGTAQPARGVATFEWVRFVQPHSGLATLTFVSG